MGHIPEYQWKRWIHHIAARVAKPSSCKLECLRPLRSMKVCHWLRHGDWYLPVHLHDDRWGSRNSQSGILEAFLRIWLQWEGTGNNRTRRFLSWNYCCVIEAAHLWRRVRKKFLRFFFSRWWANLFHIQSSWILHSLAGRIDRHIGICFGGIWKYDAVFHPFHLIYPTRTSDKTIGIRPTSPITKPTTSETPQNHTEKRQTHRKERKGRTAASPARATPSRTIGTP